MIQDTRENKAKVCGFHLSKEMVYLALVSKYWSFLTVWKIKKLVYIPPELIDISQILEMFAINSLAIIEV